jgi:GR25 family glycosyltransferase involved in LPS biosynthesis
MAESQFESMPFEFERIDAVSKIEISPKSEASRKYITDSVLAIWESHKKAFRKFLDTEDEYALILEDDFRLIKKIKFLCESWMADQKLDFFQVGYLVTRNKELLDIKYANIADLALKSAHHISNSEIFKVGTVANKFRVKSQQGIRFKTVLDDIRPGAHAYVVSRKFAEESLSLNDPAFLSTDLFFMSLGQMRTFRMGRIRISRIGQSDSSSSVEKRFTTE